jgi:hypothetical protein
MEFDGPAIVLRSKNMTSGKAGILLNITDAVIDGHDSLFLVPEVGIDQVPSGVSS